MRKLKLVAMLVWISFNTKVGGELYVRPEAITAVLIEPRTGQCFIEPQPAPPAEKPPVPIGQPGVRCLKEDAFLVCTGQLCTHIDWKGTFAELKAFLDRNMPK